MYFYKQKYIEQKTHTHLTSLSHNEYTENL